MYMVMKQYKKPGSFSLKYKLQFGGSNEVADDQIKIIIHSDRRSPIQDTIRGLNV